MVKSGKLIGCELPIRCEIDGFSFASHLDLLWRDSLGNCAVGLQERRGYPTIAYLSRNPQLGMYSYALRFGKCCCPEDGAGPPLRGRPGVVDSPEQPCAYSRKTRSAGDDGQERVRGWRASAAVQNHPRRICPTSTRSGEMF